MFQIWDATTQKLCGPQRRVRVRGTIMSSVDRAKPGAGHYSTAA